MTRWNDPDPYPNGIDIDGRDDNGNFYDDGKERVYSDPEPSTYVHEPYTQDQIYNNQLSGYNYDLVNRASELERYKGYLKEAQAEVAKWEKAIAKNEAEVAQTKIWIDNLNKKYGKT